MSDIIREVDEELRRENYLKLWRKYGQYLIGGVVGIVAVVAAVVGWREYALSQRHEDAARLIQGIQLVQAGRPDAAMEMFRAVAEDAGDGYATLASLQEAAVLAETGDVGAAVAIYERIADDSSVDPALRAAATLHAALYTLDSADPAALSRRLEPLTAPESPWRYTALELTGLLAERTGDLERARDIFARLSVDKEAPPALRARAEEMLGALGG